jgi:two-component system sensor histidine kinase RegB
VSTRSRLSSSEIENGAGGMGLGFFIAKTLLERSGGTLTMQNRDFPETGAVVEVIFQRGERSSAWAVGLK